MNRSIDLFIIFVRKGAIEGAPIFNIFGGIPSGPTAFLTLIFVSLVRTSLWVTLLKRNCSVKVTLRVMRLILSWLSCLEIAASNEVPPCSSSGSGSLIPMWLATEAKCSLKTVATSAGAFIIRPPSSKVILPALLEFLWGKKGFIVFHKFEPFESLQLFFFFKIYCPTNTVY